MIYNISQYVDDEGRQIFKKKNIADPEDYYLMGTFTVTVPTPFGPQEAQIQFEFEKLKREDVAPTFIEELEKCFKEFDELAKKEYEELLEEVREKSAENRIITPDQSGGIIMP